MYLGPGVSEVLYAQIHFDTPSDIVGVCRCPQASEGICRLAQVSSGVAGVASSRLKG